ncbi:MAG: hypothetical protein JWM39_641 [Parcubacteria group bacterium]|nr:hypothetical protein [Parcubacteria group bacterium]
MNGLFVQILLRSAHIAIVNAARSDRQPRTKKDPTLTTPGLFFLVQKCDNLFMLEFAGFL